MSQFAREYPEDYEDRIEAMRERADLERKERRENPVHEEGCACDYCNPVRPALKLAGPIPFDPWFEEPRQLARLWRWLKLMDRTPEDPAEFMENPRRWQVEYDDLCTWAGPA